MELLSRDEVSKRDEERRLRANQILEPLIREYIIKHITLRGVEFFENRWYHDPLFAHPDIQSIVQYADLDAILLPMQHELNSKGWCYRRWHTNNPATSHKAIITLERAREDDATAKRDFLELYEGKSVEEYRDNPTRYAYYSRFGVAYLWDDIKKWTGGETRVSPNTPESPPKRPLLCRLTDLCR